MIASSYDSSITTFPKFDEWLSNRMKVVSIPEDPMDEMHTYFSPLFPNLYIHTQSKPKQYIPSSPNDAISQPVPPPTRHTRET